MPARKRRVEGRMKGTGRAPLATLPAAERALLVGVEVKGTQDGWNLDDSLEELSQLALTAGAEVVGVVTQKLGAPTAGYYLGKGKLEEMASLKGETECNLIIFDDDLSPAQQRNLEEVLGLKVIDRTALILDIFAKRARTHEGRLQVELAQHEYLLPRLAGRWPHLERLGGGIGTRGPGESQLETDRRLIRRKIQRLKGELEEVRKHRALYRRQRIARGIPVVALVGYTNAGKSTLLNSLGRADVFVEDKLFATLDPTTRRLTLPGHQEVLLTDTVGFIHKLPPQVVAAFRATLEELAEAEILLHVVDITHPAAVQQCQTVDDLLQELGLGDKPRLIAVNKIDLVAAVEELRGEEAVDYYTKEFGGGVEGAVLVSAAEGWGLGGLRNAISELLAKQMMGIAVDIPYSSAELVDLFRRRGSVLSQEYHGAGTTLRGRIPRSLEPKFEPFRRSA